MSELKNIFKKVLKYLIFSLLSLYISGSINVHWSWKLGYFYRKILQCCQKLHDTLTPFIPASGALMCHLCHKKYSSSPILKRHIATVHLKIRRFRCYFCDLSFTQSGNMHCHMLRYHTVKYKLWKQDRYNY